jgi:hypothetical protein
MTQYETRCNDKIFPDCIVKISIIRPGVATAI